MDVGLTTHASNAGHPTLPHNVPLVNKPKETPLRPALPLQCHKPVTPVKVDRLNFFLTGYHPPIRQFLVNGFRYGFRVGFVGERVLPNHQILKALSSSLRLFNANSLKSLRPAESGVPFPVLPFRNLFVPL